MNGYVSHPKNVYSHLKYFTEIPKQMSVMTIRTEIGGNAFSIGNPRNAAFIS